MRDEIDWSLELKSRLIIGRMVWGFSIQSVYIDMKVNVENDSIDLE